MFRGTEKRRKSALERPIGSRKSEKGHLTMELTRDWKMAL